MKKIYFYTLIACFIVSNIFFYQFSAKAQDLETITLPYKVYPLSGNLNKIPVVNSNSPEVIKSEGILFSSFPSFDKKFKEAHLNKYFEGKFDIFTHHIAVEREKNDLTTLYQGILLYNPTDKIVTLKIISSASYLSQPDSPFIVLSDIVENNQGNIFAGPGDRVSQDILREKNFINTTDIKINPKKYFLLMNKAIPISNLTPPVNGISTLFKLESDGRLYIADLALYEKKNLFCSQKPELDDWINILNNGKLAEKRDHEPTPLDKPKPYGQPFYYGRVSGVAIGNTWNSFITNNDSEDKFILPEKNNAIVYSLNTVYANTLGTKQVQSANVEKRYFDTAYQAHSNYGITYEISIPLYNKSNEEKEISISFDTPIRISENIQQTELKFYKDPPNKIAFRGEFKIQYKNNLGIDEEKYIHIVQRFGQKGEPILNLKLKPNETRLIKINYIYPADATPPHVLTISTI